jgi:hypothetical protein
MKECTCFSINSRVSHKLKVMDGYDLYFYMYCCFVLFFSWARVNILCQAVYDIKYMRVACL